MASTTTILGHAVERREDPPLLCGTACYLADLDEEGALHAVFVRSQLAHGTISSIDDSEALSSVGVVGVFTAGDLALPDLPEWPRPGAADRPELARPCLARDRVRFVGEAVAVVVAERLEQAVDAAEKVVVDLEELPAVIDPAEALGEGAPLLFADHGSNAVLVVEGNDPGALEEAEVVVRGRFYSQRVAPVPLEPNGALVRPGPGGSLECFFSTQAPFGARAGVARALGRPPESVRVIAPAVGGGFGAKGGVYPEQVVTAALAARLGRPVRWIETRSENLLAMSHGRGQLQEAALGARRDGTIVGLEAKMVTEMGAYCWRGAIPFQTSRLMSTGVYRVPRLHLTSIGVVTNATPIGPYRGAGRPEATSMLERLVELLAHELALDPVELRRRNLLAPGDFPYETLSGASYDSGDYAAALDRALELAGYDSLRAEQARRRAEGSKRHLGIGISTFVEVSGSGSEFGAVRLDDNGTVVVTTGSSPHGQGHETTLAQLAASVLGVELDEVRVVHSDTAVVPRGVGTFGSRSGQLAGNAVARSAELVREQARELAAELLEAAVDDVVEEGGRYGVAGVPARTLSLAELAAVASKGRVSGSPAVCLEAESDFAQAAGTYPFGAHVAVVEVDEETGKVDLVRYVAVDDCGEIINPVIVAGQLHGGLAQGIAQALYEEMRYDEHGTPLTASLVDYAVPSAAELPSYELGETVTASPRNPLGLKGVGESGSVGSSAAVQNAVLDVLSGFGVRHLDTPLSPERVWRAIETARAEGAAPAR